MKESLIGKPLKIAAHQSRDIRLGNANELSGAAVWERPLERMIEAMPMTRSAFRNMLVGVRHADVSKNVTAAFCAPC